MFYKLKTNLDIVKIIQYPIIINNSVSGCWLYSQETQENKVQIKNFR